MVGPHTPLTSRGRATRGTRAPTTAHSPERDIGVLPRFTVLHLFCSLISHLFARESQDPIQLLPLSTVPTLSQLRKCPGLISSPMISATSVSSSTLPRSIPSTLPRLWLSLPPASGIDRKLALLRLLRDCETLLAPRPSECLLHGSPPQLTDSIDNLSRPLKVRSAISLIRSSGPS